LHEVQSWGRLLVSMPSEVQVEICGSSRALGMPVPRLSAVLRLERRIEFNEHLETVRTR